MVRDVKTGRISEEDKHAELKLMINCFSIIRAHISRQINLDEAPFFFFVTHSLMISFDMV